MLKAILWLSGVAVTWTLVGMWVAMTLFVRVERITTEGPERVSYIQVRRDVPVLKHVRHYVLRPCDMPLRVRASAD